MARLSLRDRFYTRRVGNAMMSPGAIVLAGAGAGLAIISGLPLVVAPLAGAAAWGARVVAAMPRARATPSVDPFKLPEPWREPVSDALAAQERYQRAAQLADPGPVRTRLEQIGRRIADGVVEVKQIARRGHLLSEGLEHIDADDARAALAELDHTVAAANDPVTERTREALQSQIEASDRVAALLTDIRSRLQYLDARLNESVARAVELSLNISDAGDLGAVGDDIDGVVTEMEALRRALDETTQTARGTPDSP